MKKPSPEGVGSESQLGRVRIKDITPGQPVTHRLGYSNRPAVVENVDTQGRVSIRYTDVDRAAARSIPPTHRGRLYGATVRPQFLDPRKDA